MALAACWVLSACASDTADEPAASDVGPAGSEAVATSAQVAAGGGDLPCDIAPIIKKNCSLCHGDEPSFGAPFSLLKTSDFSSRAAAVSQRVKLTGPGRMPPVSSPAIPAADLTKLTSWLDSGAKAASPGCTVDGTAGGTDAGGPSVSTSSGKAHKDPIDYQDPNLKCYKFTAYAAAGRKDTPYSVPTTPDYYVNFTIKAPWSGTQYIRSFKSIIDNKAVLHHWLFFRALSAKPEGVAKSTGAHPDDEMLFGWAPGGDNMYFDPDLAMEAPSGSFIVEAHYNNTTGRASPDASGVEVCVTPTKPSKVAGLSWVGTDSIFGASATGTCRPTSGQVAHIVAAQPHMHKKGIHMKVVQSKGGRTTVVHDQPFDFNYQRMYLMDVDVAPGDTLTTTCTYNGPARFGPNTSDEMCYFFSIHWPNGALRGGSALGSVLHGPNSCL